MGQTVPPKRPADRRRQNKTGPKVQKVADKKGKVPALTGAGWLPAGKAYWKTIWESPMSQLWLPADIPALKRLTRLAQLAETEMIGTEKLQEMRQLEDRFGLSPKARRMLLIEIGDDPASSGGQVSPDQSQDDPRFLRLVK